MHSQEKSQTVLPRWRGFNLIDMFSRRKEWGDIFPMEDDGNPVEEDFRLIAELGFNFVRVPMSYRFLTKDDDDLALDEAKMDRVDRIVRLGEKYGLHVSLTFHRVPGYCIVDDEEETRYLWRDREALDAFCANWSYFARRYGGIGS